MKLTGMLCAALVAAVVLGSAMPATAVAAGAEEAQSSAEMDRAVAELSAVLDAVQAEQDKCVAEAKGAKAAAACLPPPPMQQVDPKQVLNISGDASAKACLMEGHYVDDKADGATVNQKQCFENQGVAQADFSRSCESFLRVAMQVAGGGDHTLIYMRSCPRNAASMCKNLFEQPIVAYNYEASDKPANSLCANPVTF